MPPIDLTDPIALLLASHEALGAAGLTAATYGGLALAVYGVPRETRDADLAVVGFDLETALTAFRTAGHDVTPVFDAITFGGLRISRMAITGGGELNTVDLVTPRSERLGTALMSRALSGTLLDRTVLVVSPEDFVLLKLLSTRDRDLEDAASVVSALGTLLDRGLIDAEVALLAGEIGDHDVRARAQRLPR
ncbi:MAG: nucleotidyl transferase AbiEii/AbiGii toxin family protein [Deltaproteobacteria bacterium]|nr:nucleotidyl transferase AbiEii/AbiGii toxin family protein [Kofleriaceae bacterium]